MKIDTHYDNLNIARDASPDEVKRAFRKLTFQHHPDRHPSEDKALQQRRLRIIKEAYAILSDEVKRREHDAWIAQQEFAYRERRRAEQKGEYDEENTYQRNRDRQDMYYKELLEKERAINLTLRDANTQLENDLASAGKVANSLREENQALKRRGTELTMEIGRLKSEVDGFPSRQSKAMLSLTRLNKGLTWAIGLCAIIIGAQLANKYLYSPFNTQVLTVLDENLKGQPKTVTPQWRVYDWNQQQFILSKESEAGKSFINIVSQGQVTQASMIDALQGRRVGSEECDQKKPKSALNRGQSVQYRFVQLETDTVVSVTVPYTHLCKPHR